MPELDAYLDGVLVGRFQQSAGGTITFGYRDDATSRTPMSLSMPRTLTEHKQRAARPYLEGLLPDNPGALQAIATEYGTSPGSLFGMLTGVGREVPGALQLLPPDADPDDTTRGAPTGEEADDEAIAERLRTAIEVYRDGRTTRDVDFRFSLPGAQAKIALTRTPDGRWLVPDLRTATTHIFKPSSADQPLPDMDVAEGITLEAARRLGLEVPNTDTWRSPDGELSALVVERYDRRYDESGSIRRLHQEDLTQALSVPPSKKYQADGGPGVGKVGELIRGRIPARDQHDVALSFFRGFVFNIATLGTDAHAKNYSLLLDQNRVALAPLYDLVSAALYYDADKSSRKLRPSMWVGGERSFERVTPDSLAAEGVRLGLKRDEAAEVVATILSGAADALLSAASDVGRHDMAAAAERNLATFSPARFDV
ncbi:MAG: HipA domain-containing protein [Microbacterium sp.]|nr:HipA domain-containing protein [Microbacterium sp.]